MMAANNEIGVIQPVADIGRSCAASAACIFHTDAVQADR
jgi:cysteine sulfinate desulfinase/cysteine desulfurase-like protein